MLQQADKLGCRTFITPQVLRNVHAQTNLFMSSLFVVKIALVFFSIIEKLLQAAVNTKNLKIFRVYFYKFYLFVNMYSNGCQLLIT